MDTKKQIKFIVIFTIAVIAAIASGIALAIIQVNNGTLPSKEQPIEKEFKDINEE
ncbi:MAG: hypothetical protein WBG70_13160 [Spirulinaceae cyanobacterium]